MASKEKEDSKGKESSIKIEKEPTSASQGRPQGDTDYRVVVFGAAGVGKTSLVLRFVKGTYKDNYVPTIEDTYRHVLTSGKTVCTLQITDTTGSHQFPAMQRLNIQKGHSFMLVYSIANKASVQDLVPIYDDIVKIKGQAEIKNVPMILVGTKSDEPREVQTAAAEKVAHQWGCAFIETSAKNNTNIKEAFHELLKLDQRHVSLFSEDGASSSSGGKNSVKQKKGAAKDKPKQAKKKCNLM